MCNSEGVLLAGWSSRFFDQLLYPLDFSSWLKSFLTKWLLWLSSKNDDSFVWYVPPFLLVPWSKLLFGTFRASGSKRLKQDFADNDPATEIDIKTLENRSNRRSKFKFRHCKYKLNHCYLFGTNYFVAFENKSLQMPENLVLVGSIWKQENSDLEVEGSGSTPEEVQATIDFSLIFSKHRKWIWLYLS